jgi:hypothetical protein
MDSRELKGFAEAYQAVYTPQEVDEAVKGASRHDTEMRKAASTERKAGIKNRLSPAAGKDNADKMQRDIKFFDKLTKKNKNVVGLVAKEEVERLGEETQQLDEISQRTAPIAESDYNYQRALQSKKQGKKTMRKAIGGKIDAATKRIKDMKKSGEWYKEQADIYDIILSHLIAEGYADTNESALVIMANMSEEWRQSIVEGDNYDKNRKRAAQRAAERNAARDAGKTGNVPGVGYVTPRRERETYVDAAGTTRHKSGAKMP